MKAVASALGILAAGCAHGGPARNGPVDVSRSYARALDAGNVDEAWALSASLDREQFAERYADPLARHQRAQDVTRAADGQPSAKVTLEVTAKGWRVLEAPVAGLADEQQARDVLNRFLAALDSGDFQTVFSDLSAVWRARYTPERLKADFASEPVALSRVERIRAARAAAWDVTLAGPRLPLGEGKSLKLVREGGALKISALE